MRISVVIPTFQRLESLESCLECLFPQVTNTSLTPIEIIVTDDSTNASARDLVANYSPIVRWIQGPHRGPSANRNNGVKHASGDWIIFTDDDCLPQPDFLENYITAIRKNGDVKVFEGKTIANRTKIRFDEESPVNLTGGFLWSCNFCIEKTFFNQLGGFDESFVYAAMEDVDFRVRINKAQMRILFCESAVVVHPWVIRDKIANAKNHFKSTLIFLEKHPEFKKEINSVYYLRWIIKDFLFNFSKNIIKYNFKGSRFIIKNYIQQMKNSAYLFIHK